MHKIKSALFTVTLSYYAIVSILKFYRKVQFNDQINEFPNYSKSAVKGNGGEIGN